MSEALIQTDEKRLAMRRHLTKMKAADAFHGPGFDRLIGMLESDDERIVLAVMNFLGKISGDMRTTQSPVQVTFNQLIKNQSSDGPLSKITQITESAVIDAEDGDSDDE